MGVKLYLCVCMSTNIFNLLHLIEDFCFCNKESGMSKIRETFFDDNEQLFIIGKEMLQRLGKDKAASVKACKACHDTATDPFDARTPALSKVA